MEKYTQLRINNKNKKKELITLFSAGELIKYGDGQGKGDSMSFFWGEVHEYLCLNE